MSCSAPPGGVRACADFFGDEAFLVISGDALTDIDLSAFVARHREAGGIATLAVKQVSDTREYGVVLHDREGRITGFQEKPNPRGGSVGSRQLRHLHLRARDLRLLPGASVRGLGAGRVPGAFGERLPFHIHEVEGLLERRWFAGRAAPGHVRRPARRAALAGRGREVCARCDRSRARASLPDSAEVDGPVWIGHDVQIGDGVRLTGPIVLGDSAQRRRGSAAARQHRSPWYQRHSGGDLDRRDRRALGNPGEFAGEMKRRGLRSDETGIGPQLRSDEKGLTGRRNIYPVEHPCKPGGQPPRRGVAWSYKRLRVKGVPDADRHQGP